MLASSGFSPAHVILATLGESQATEIVQLNFRSGSYEHVGNNWQRSPEILLSFELKVIHRIKMPIRPENRWLYPIDWQQLSNTIRFGRARGRCEHCARPHLCFVVHLGDGRWWDAEIGYWRSTRGQRTTVRDHVDLASVRTTYVVLACAHLDHNPTHNKPANLAALCQRCHMMHDAIEHHWQRWWNVFRKCALRDLYEDPRITRDRLRQQSRIR